MEYGYARDWRRIITKYLLKLMTYDANNISSIKDIKLSTMPFWKKQMEWKYTRREVKNMVRCFQWELIYMMIKLML
jgi:hypothetical protein